ncbi:MAG: efflux RND transporter periplasmic adaptor subunit, partial [Phycisphaerae bacterium]
MLETSGRPANVLRSVLLSVGVLAVGAGVGGTLLALRVEPARRDNPALPPLVDTLTVATEDVVEHFIGYGTVRSARTAKVAAEVAANVTARGEGVREGSVVHEGQALVHLDDQAYRHALERARAQAAAEAAALEELEAEVGSLQDLIETAQRELRVAANERDRVTALFEGDLAAKKELDEARLAYDRANRVLQGFLRQTALLAPRRKRLEASKRALEAEAALAELNTERCRIVAPFDGRIERLDVDEGDRVSPGWVVAVLIDPDRVEIPLRLPALVYD